MSKSTTMASFLVAAAIFSFQNNFWVNLHQFLHAEAGRPLRSSPRALGKTGDSHYLPYAYRFSVYEKGMLPDRGSLEKNWQPWLDARVPFEEALRNLVRDVGR